MTSSPKPTLPIRKPNATTLITFQIIFVLAAIFSLGVVFGQCGRRGGTWSVRVIWGKSTGGSRGVEVVGITNGSDLLRDVRVNVHADEVAELGVERHKAMAFVGIMTGYGSAGRRRSLRSTWMPSDQRSLLRMEEETGLAMRFVIGKTSDKAQAQELENEVLEHDDFMVLDMEQERLKPAYKTLLFLRAAYALYDCDFYVRVGDDIYLRPDRLSLLLAGDRSHPQTYLGCMTRDEDPLGPPLNPYEKSLVGGKYLLHAQRSIYALSTDLVANLISLGHDRLRMLGSEDATIGAWMVAMNVSFEHNALLCSSECSTRSIVVTDFPSCSGLCEAEEKLLELHGEETCSKSPTIAEYALRFLEWGMLANHKESGQEKLKHALREKH
uniref:Hexosyltransferase n=1 Tax=Kalanchoe fedtschenkoi TaxID=63787 RepID=A0A7N1A8Y5_KALFE